MNRGIIAICETGAVTMPTIPVWMTQQEIADLFGVFSCQIRNAIRSIYKSEEVSELDTMGTSDKQMESVMTFITLKWL